MKSKGSSPLYGQVSAEGTGLGATPRMPLSRRSKAPSGSTLKSTGAMSRRNSGSRAGLEPGRMAGMTRKRPRDAANRCETVPMTSWACQTPRSSPTKTTQAGEASRAFCRSFCQFRPG